MEAALCVALPDGPTEGVVACPEACVATAPANIAAKRTLHRRMCDPRVCGKRIAIGLAIEQERSGLFSPCGALPQRLVIKYEAILHGVPGRRIRTSSLRKVALFHAPSMNNPRQTIVSLDATRLGVKSVVLVALPGDVLLGGPWP